MGPTLIQPTGRRPSWGKNSSNHKTRFSCAGVPIRANAIDYGLDNFSFDPAYLAEFKIPKHLTNPLPKALRDAASNFVCAGAAVQTAFHRIEKLDANAVLPGTAPSSRSESMSRTMSDPPSAIGSGTGTPTTSPPLSFDGSIQAPVSKYNKFPVVNPYTQLHTSMLGMESPPFTPVDSRAPGTPTNSIAIPAGTGLDISRLHAQLATVPEDPLTSSSLGTPNYSGTEYVSHARTHNAEIHDIQFNCLPRFTGYDRQIRKLLALCEAKGIASGEQKIALVNLLEWWWEQRHVVSEYKRKVGALQGKPVP